MNAAGFLPASLSARVVWGIALFLVVYQLLYGFSPTVISWDTYGYYLYLPQTLIHGDPGLHDMTPVNEALGNTVMSDTFYQAARSDIGEWVIKYPMGLAVFYLPFFLIGYAVAWIGGYPTDGFSLPFQHAVTIGSLFYTLLGLWFLRKVLLRFFSERQTVLVLLLLVFGTNYFHIHTRSHGMPHVYLFTAYAALLWFTIRWHEDRQKKHAFAIGIVLGLMTLSRVTELMAILIPLLYGLQSPAQLFSHLRTLLRNYKHLLIAGTVLIILVFPQLLYWKVYSGEWLYDSYRNSGEGLDFLHPHTVEFLFSYRKGWFLYTPLMLLSLWGLVQAFRKKSPWRWPVLTVFALFVYVAGSWTTWWYAACFSQRTMVQLYPVLALPLGMALTTGTKSLRMALTGFAGLCVVLNLFQTWQYNEGIIHIDRMTKRYYWMVFGKTEIPPGAEKYLLVNRSTGPNDFIENYDNYIPVKTWYLQAKDNVLYPVRSSGDSLLLLPQKFSPKFEMTFRKLCTKDHAWIHISGIIPADSTYTFPGMYVISTFEHGGVAYKYRYDPLETLVYWNKAGYFDFHLLYLTPEVRRPENQFQFYFHHSGDKDTVSVHDLKLQVLERKELFD